MTTSPLTSSTDDIVLPFQIEHVEASGRLVRLGPAIDDILRRHAYPDPVSELLGQALLLVAMFGSMIKDRRTQEAGAPASAEAGSDQTTGQKERFILQTQSDGPVSLLVADYVAPGQLRGYARFDTARLEERGQTDQPQKSDAPDRLAVLLGNGHLAMTIDKGAETDRYQGIVALEDNGPNAGLSGAANLYFEQSEQLPTFISLAMARHFDAQRRNEAGDTDAEDRNGDGWHWRGGALLVQKLTAVGGHQGKATADQSDTSGPELWTRALVLAQTIKDHELLDPLLPPPDLLYRLYHEDGVRVFDPLPVRAGCTCSLQGVERMLAGFSPDDQREMIREDGLVHITCEFCNRAYRLTPPAP